MKTEDGGSKPVVNKKIFSNTVRLYELIVDCNASICDLNMRVTFNLQVEQLQMIITIGMLKNGHHMRFF